MLSQKNVRNLPDLINLNSYTADMFNNNKNIVSLDIYLFFKYLFEIKFVGLVLINFFIKYIFT